MHHANPLFNDYNTDNFSVFLLHFSQLIYVNMEYCHVLRIWKEFIRSEIITVFIFMLWYLWSQEGKSLFGFMLQSGQRRLYPGPPPFSVTMRDVQRWKHNIPGPLGKWNILLLKWLKKLSDCKLGLIQFCKAFYKFS